MNHIKLHIEATEIEQEQLVALLAFSGPTGFEQTDTHLFAYFEEKAFNQEELHEVLKKFSYAISTVPEQNWNAVWEEGFRPVVMGNFCAVRAHFHAPVAGVKHEIVITPKMSFGTGHHATTYMMLEQMETLDFTAANVLDFGTGTGILAILAEKMGAAQVSAIDNDIWSFENVRENLFLNHCTHVLPLLTEAIPETRSYQIILANITKNVLLSYMGILKSSLRKNGYLLLSGFLEIDKTEMTTVAENWGMKLVLEKNRDGWLSLLFVN